MKKALACALSMALLLSMTACNKPQAEQPDNSQPDPAAALNQTDTTTPDTLTPEQLSDTTPTAPGTNGVPQGQTDADTQGPAEEPSYFTEVSEDVWVTGTVNIRAEPSMEGEILGQFNQGDSTIRTGIGIEEYLDWSRVEFGESTVYVATSYLSTSKVNPPSANTNTQRPSTSSSSSSSGDKGEQDRYRESREAIGHGKAGFARPPESPEEKARIDQENFDYQTSQGRKPMYEDGKITGWEWDY